MTDPTNEPSASHRLPADSDALPRMPRWLWVAVVAALLGGGGGSTLTQMIGGGHDVSGLEKSIALMGSTITQINGTVLGIQDTLRTDAARSRDLDVKVALMEQRITTLEKKVR